MILRTHTVSLDEQIKPKFMCISVKDLLNNAKKKQRILSDRCECHWMHKCIDDLWSSDSKITETTGSVDDLKFDFGLQFFFCTQNGAKSRHQKQKPNGTFSVRSIGFVLRMHNGKLQLNTINYNCRVDFRVFLCEWNVRVCCYYNACVQILLLLMISILEPTEYQI